MNGRKLFELLTSDCELLGKYILVVSSTSVWQAVLDASLKKYTPDLCAMTLEILVMLGE